MTKMMIIMIIATPLDETMMRNTDAWKKKSC